MVESLEISEIYTTSGSVPVISTTLTFKDKLNNFKVRLGINRYNYKIKPGLYAIGSPNSNSMVLVTSNYKLTFDTLRKNLCGLNLWIIVIDTNGINVWCAAGKGTFGNYEILKIINKVKLKDIISHNTIILPQLGAPGVASHTISKAGFKVVFGPVRAEDIKEFLNNGMVKTKAMKQVNFTLKDRVVLTPMEFIPGLKYALPFFPLILVFNIFLYGNFINSLFLTFINYIPLFIALIIGTALVPIFLPYIPFRAFALKGLTLSGIWSFVFYNYFYIFLIPDSTIVKIAFMLFIAFISSYTALQFTGSSTYTSLSGTTKETIYSIIFGVLCSLIGIILLIIYIVR